MFKHIINFWHSRQRATDLQILWPVCKEKASDLDHAKVAFAYHAFNDDAWMCLSHDEVVKKIGELS